MVVRYRQARNVGLHIYTSQPALRLKPPRFVWCWPIRTADDGGGKISRPQKPDGGAELGCVR